MSKGIFPPPVGDAPCLPESGLRPSIRYSLEDLIKKKRNEAYQLESLLRELPILSHDADRAIWDMICGNAAGFR